MTPDGTNDSSTVVYFYDGTLEGFFSAVFDAYTGKDRPDIITVSENYQSRIDQIIHHVQTREDKYERVYDGIIKHIGPVGYHKVRTVFLSPSPDKDTILFRYLEYGFKVGKKIHVDISHELVNPVERLKKETWFEMHRMKMFARFAQMDNGVYFSKINPKCNVLPLVMEHFARRFNVQPFVIYDENHRILGLYDMKSWYLQYVDDDFEVPDCAEDDLRYQRLWKSFYDSIAIEERVNHDLRRNFMPKRFWSNLTEMSFIDPKDTIGHLGLSDSSSGSVVAHDELLPPEQRALPEQDASLF
ncbi:MAG: TIGR03915 family putative DNA repair protein [Coriobacteriia bacterium]|nr:TIGR03915 family putative DNA repair protein [Coriobacteriia bacterium]